MKRPGPLLAALLLACGVAAGALPASAHAAGPRGRLVCEVEDDCRPDVSLAPSSGSYGSQSLSITATYYQGLFGLRETTATVTVQPSSAGGTFTYQADSNDPLHAGTSSGTVTLPADGSPVTVTAHICSRTTPQVCNDATETYRYQQPPQVIALLSQVLRVRGEALLERFKVVNPGTTPAVYSFDGVCDMAVTVCQAGTGHVTLAPHDSVVVGVNYRLTSSGSAGSVGLTVSDGLGGQAFGSTLVLVTGWTREPGMVGLRDLTLLERSMCVTIGIGPGSAYECGDLRLAHPLPTTRVLGKARTPTLIYNSQTASPFPIVAGQVIRDFSVPRPDSLLARLMIGGVQVASQKYKGFIADTVRVAVGFDATAGGATARPTGVYDYQLEVTGYSSAGVSTVYNRTGRLAIVNRMASFFGRGWWLAGLEQLVPVSSTELLWVGGDGSTRLYTRVQTDTTRWVGPLFDAPDTLLANPAGGYMRSPTYGDTLFYDATGRQVRSKNALGYSTTFTWSSGKLTGIQLPIGDQGYTFSYTGGSSLAAAGMLAEVIAPGTIDIPDSARVVRLETYGTDVRRIYDPQYRAKVAVGSPMIPDSVANVGFTTTTGRITTRSDRVGAVYAFRYGAGGLLSVDTLRSSPLPLAVTTFRPAESQGVGTTTAPRDTAVYTLYDGPRPATEVVDQIRFYLDTWGAPWKVVDPFRATTVVRRRGMFPALVTSTTTPTGSESTASYDDRGRLVSSTDWSVTTPDGRYPTTTYEYDPKWDQVTRTTGPLGEVSLTRYDSRGRPLWSQGSGDSTRVYFGYDPVTGLPSTVTTPASAEPARFYYNVLGNLNQTVSPMGFHTWRYGDAIGQDTLVVTPTDSAETPAYRVRTRTWYTIMGLDTLTVTSAPSLSAFAPARTLAVRQVFDAEGRVRKVFRRAAPDTTWIHREYSYDLAGRKNGEWDEIGQNQMWTYDAAGNVLQWITARSDYTVKMRYDAMNRMIRREIPEVYYDDWQPYGVSLQWHFPRGGAGYTIPAQVDTFAYDSLTGGLRLADNPYARIRRTYYPNGALKTDSVYLRSWADLAHGGGWHAYGIGHGYDVEGRQIWLKHPHNLAPTAYGGSVADSAVYTYDRATGALSTISSVLGNLYWFRYDAAGRLRRLDSPAGGVETWTYDDDGRVSTRYRNTVPYQDAWRYDARGKVLAHGEGTFQYDGMGSLVVSSGRTYVTTIYRVDALGNRIHSEGPTAADNRDFHLVYGRTAGWTFQFDTFALSQASNRVAPNRTTDTGEYEVDEMGNTVHQTSDVGGPSTYTLNRTAMFYDALNRLRAVDQRYCGWTVTDATGDWTYSWTQYLNNQGHCDPYWNRSFDQRGSFEEYRHDALGRRIAVRMVPDTACITSCEPTLTETVWDGNQVLYEVQYDANLTGNANEASLPSGGPDRYLFGWVGYTHGLGIDAPLDIMRMGFTATTDAPAVIVPSANALGNFDTGRQISGPTVSMWWPAERTPPGSTYRVMNPPPSWMGSLIGGQRDNSGLLYRRNRYYDSNTGQFTQSDPIGLAGGLSVYGFAEGDPVSYADPYGLFADTVKYNGTRVTLVGDDGSVKWSGEATSGVPGSTAADQGTENVGPIPEGEYTLNPKEISEVHGFRYELRQQFGDWGHYRVRLHANPGTDTHGRDRFFLHGAATPGSLGCIAVPEGTAEAQLFSLLSQLHSPVTVKVHYPSRNTRTGGPAQAAMFARGQWTP